MRIGVNLLFLLPGQLAGIATYATNLVRALARLDSDNRYFLFVNKETKDYFRDSANQFNFREIVCNVRASFRPARLLWEQFLLPLQLRQYNVDLVHSPGYFSALLAPCRSVTTVLDLNFIYARRSFSPAGYVVWRLMVPLSVRQTDKIITISQSSKRDIVQFFDMAPEMVQVIYLAASGVRPDRWRQSSVNLSRYGIRGRPVLSVASSHPHKNLRRLVEAYNILIRTQNVENQLVLVGHRCADFDLLEQMVRQLGLQGRVILTGYISDDHLMALYSRAALFVLPSLYEGFGIPILDAMIRGVPVACSGVAALPEVAGGAALLFDPYDVEDIAAKIGRLLQEAELSRMLVRKGYENVKRFSWERTAKQTLDVYRKVYNGAS